MKASKARKYWCPTLQTARLNKQLVSHSVSQTEHEFKTWMQAIAARTETALAQALPVETQVPQRLHSAMRYAVLGGGKRVRPLLAHAAGEVVAAQAQDVDVVACAVEMIHAYSLVHDDLPCMDDDDLRRGRPTVHKAYDEATALLVGDALQSQAFIHLAAWQHSSALAVVQELALASGSFGMAGGQAIDLASVGLKLTRPELEGMHQLKTGALLRASIRMGAACGAQPVSAVTRQALDDYAAAVGLAFQVVDDVLDATADTATLGKTAGKDAADDKPTYVSLLGIEAAQVLAEDLRMAAHTALAKIAAPTQRLGALADYIVLRSY